MRRPNSSARPRVMLAFTSVATLALTSQVYWYCWNELQLQLRLPVNSSSSDSSEHGSTLGNSGSADDLQQETQYGIHAELIRRGAEEVRQGFDDHRQEVTLTRKYWELVAWFKSLSMLDPVLVPVPVPYDFGNRSLWDPGFEGAVDKVLAQVVWRLQLLIGNYARGLTENHANLAPYRQHSSTNTRPKRIFVGNMSFWPDWALLPGWRESRIISGCYSNLPLVARLAADEPTCELVETESPGGWNWTDIDLIAQIHDNPLAANSGPVLARSRVPVPWIWYTAEPPGVYKVTEADRTRVHLTHSYMSDSPVQHKYMKWIYYDPAVSWRAQQPGNYSLGKRKMVAMLVSNCAARNGRIAYARELQRHIDVDIFGSCGDTPCGRTHDECFKILRRYKFYLAFENSNCEEYVTEKLHRNALENGILPVVMGAPPAFYRLHAPQNSYIHVQDFEGPRELAAYLHVLAANSTMYNDYFAWRGTGEPAALVATPWLCSVCALLYQRTPLSLEVNRQGQIWSSSTRNERPLCLEQGRWYWPVLEASPFEELNGLTQMENQSQ